MYNFGDVVTTREAATLLHIDRSVLIKLVSDGRLTPVHRLPGKTGAYLFSLGDIEEMRVKTTRRHVTSPAT